MPAKYKKVVPNQQAVEPMRQTITINSDGNVMELQGISAGVRTFKYIKSNTKLGLTVTFTEEEYNKFIYNNSSFKTQNFKLWQQKH